jgi:hypothetical protein
VGNHLGLVELILVFAGVLGLAVWDLLATKRAVDRDRTAVAASKPDAKPTPKSNAPGGKPRAKPRSRPKPAPARE